LDLEYIDNGKLTFIRSISITPSGFIYSIKEPEMTNKVLRRFASIQDSFIRVHFEDENMAMLKNMKFVCEVFFKK
jgi:RNA-dependent RNA polymerase